MLSILSDAHAIHIKAINTLLDDYLKNGRAQNLAKTNSVMTQYHLASGGKRLRALIPCLVFETFGRKPSDAYVLASAVELIHNATLVHDDLQDGDEVRRNHPTVWKKFSPAQAINCGDAMLYFALDVLLAHSGFPARSLNRTIQTFVENCLHVIEGQSLEFLLKDGPLPKMENYLHVVQGKTSGLFALPFESALSALDVPEEVVFKTRSITKTLGTAFQIQDDYIDLYGNKGRGEHQATDIAEGKISYFVVHTLNAATTTEQNTLLTILKLPRQQTDATAINTALQLFEKYQAKRAAIEYLASLQNELLTSIEDLEEVPKGFKVLLKTVAQDFTNLHA